MRLVCVYGVDEENREDRKNGTDGTDGTNGTNGIDGIDGMNGKFPSSEALPSLLSSEAIPFIPAPAHLSQRTYFSREGLQMQRSAKIPTMGCTRSTVHCRDSFC